MSNTKRILLANGLLFAVSIGRAPGACASADEPPARSPSPSTSADAERYLLLTDGRLISGKITHDDLQYTVMQKLGVIRFPKRQVERSFDTVQEAYRYRLERVPEDDPAERLRLARWCLNLRLTDEAKSQLENVLQISPEHDAAKAMLEQITRSELGRAERSRDKVDTAVRQTAAEDVAEDRAGALDSAVFRGAERRMGITGLPVIFDLPQALAIQRTEQYKQYVHPILQAYCAKCHNGEYDGDFQLVPTSTARQRTPDALRSNLDATLRQIDSNDPTRSELLLSTLRPHGMGSRRRPIFTGSNDRAYRILAAWVHSLRPADGSAAGAAEGRPRAGETDQTFAADRNRTGAGLLEPLVQGIRTGDPRRLPTIANPAGAIPPGRPSRGLQGSAVPPDDRPQSDADEFPLPFMLGGPRPKLPSTTSAREAGRTASATPKTGAIPTPNAASGAEPAALESDTSPPIAPARRRPVTSRRTLGCRGGEEEARQARPRPPQKTPEEQRRATRRRLRLGSIVDRLAGA